jgi:hypothetical protein
MERYFLFIFEANDVFFELNHGNILLKNPLEGPFLPISQFLLAEDDA